MMCWELGGGTPDLQCVVTFQENDERKSVGCRLIERSETDYGTKRWHDSLCESID